MVAVGVVPVLQQIAPGVQIVTGSVPDSTRSVFVDADSIRDLLEI